MYLIFSKSGWVCLKNSSITVQFRNFLRNKSVVEESISVSETNVVEKDQVQISTKGQYNEGHIVVSLTCWTKTSFEIKPLC